MQGIGWQIGLLVVMFFLVVILGLQIQISSLQREIDDLKYKRRD